MYEYKRGRNRHCEVAPEPAGQLAAAEVATARAPGGYLGGACQFTIGARARQGRAAAGMCVPRRRHARGLRPRSFCRAFAPATGRETPASGSVLSAQWTSQCVTPASARTFYTAFV